MLFISEGNTPKRKHPCEQCSKAASEQHPTNSNPQLGSTEELAYPDSRWKTKVLSFLPSLVLFGVPEREELGKIN